MFSQWNINIIFKCQLFTNFFKNKETVLLKIQKYISWKENPQDEIIRFLYIRDVRPAPRKRAAPPRKKAGLAPPRPQKLANPAGRGGAKLIWIPW